MKTIKCVDILLPQVDEPQKWAVVSCDQFTSQRDYWQALDDFVGDAPSALRLIYPEVYLGDGDSEDRIRRINNTMRDYLSNGIFRILTDSFILIKRDTSYGASRLGAIVAVDLEDYSYVYPTEARLRATEGVVLDRIPPRLSIRKDATIELPHILIVMDDRQKCVLEKLWEKREQLEKLYDFDLNMKGGHLTGYRVDSADLLDKLAVYEESVKNLYGVATDFAYAVGDGNHSLATAQAHWNELKKNLSAEERESHPARYALCELENLHDDGIQFEPIHRFVFGADEDFVAYLSDKMSGEGRLRVFNSCVEYSIPCNALSAECIAEIQSAIDEYLFLHRECSVDYIHGEEHLRKIAEENEGIAIFMPSIIKEELFSYVVEHGNLCRKAFSMGEAEEKRYYYEAHKITNKD